jgi:hypothetical protein
LWGRNLVEPGFERAVGILGDVQDEAKLAAVYFEVPCQSPEMSWARETDDAKTTSARVVKSLFILRKMESPLIHLETSNIETSFLLRN